MTDDESALRALGMRPTLPRLAVFRVLRRKSDSHVTPHEAYALVHAAGLRPTLGTVYNVLNDFARVGLLTRIEMGERTFYCGNPKPHHHFLDEEGKRLFDIDDPQPQVSDLPVPPPGMEIAGVDVIIRLRPARR